MIFLVSGFWHGANWTFIFWGLLHSLFFLPLLLLKKNRKHKDIVAANRHLPNGKDLIRMLTTFLLVSLAWVFFRSESITQAMFYIDGMIDYSLFSWPRYLPLSLLILIAFFTVIEWRGRFCDHPLEVLTQNVFIRWLIYVLLALLILLSKGNPQDFIYFQF